MSLLTCEEREIDGKTYQIRCLNVIEGRKVYHRIQKLMAIVGDEDNLKGIDPIFAAIFAGAVDEADVDFLIAKFATVTTVDMGDGRVVSLKDQKVQDELFAGNLESLFAWLSACVNVNFAGVIAKTRSALSNFGDKAQDSQPKE